MADERQMLVTAKSLTRKTSQSSETSKTADLIPSNMSDVLAAVESIELDLDD